MRTRRVNGATVRALRVAVGINQETLAGRLNVSPGYMSRIESGEKQPSERLVSSLCICLGVSKDAITYPASVEVVAASPTQKLRDLIDDLAWGGTRFMDLMTELDRVELELDLPSTTPTDDYIDSEGEGK